MEPLGPPTWMTCVATIPSAAAIDPVAEAIAAVEARVSEAATPAAPVAFMAISPACVVADPSPRRAETTTDLEKYIFAVGDGIVKE